MVGKPALMLMGNSESIDRQMYVGVVVTDHNNDTLVDPEKNQRLKIRLRGLHEGVTDEQLPWAMKAGGQAGGGGGMGSAGMPPAGTKVYVYMKANDPYHLEYGGSAPATNDTKLEEEFEEFYGHAQGAIDAAGNKFVQVTKQGANITKFHHASGSTFDIGDDGTVTINSAKKIVFSSQEEIEFVSGKKVKIHGEKFEVATKKEIMLSSEEEPITLATAQVIGPMPIGAADPLEVGTPTATTARSRPAPNLKVA